MGASTLLALAGMIAVPGVASAQLPAGCTQAGPMVTCTYGFTGGPQTFTVPAGTTTVHVVAVGGGGGAGTSLPGGRGARVEADLTGLTAGPLTVVVGGPGSQGGAGFNGGGAAGIGTAGGGGGASDVRGAGGGLADRLLVAAGGGGSAEEYNLRIGRGGDAGSPGAGTAGETAGAGGQPGTAGAGGAGGDGGVRGGDGVPGTGGAGAAGSPSGGGGGGGLFGGGGGGSGRRGSVGGTTGVQTAGGGGGGSSLVPPGGTLVIDPGAPSVTISYLVDGTGPVITPTVNGTLGGAGWYTSDVAVSWSVTDPESPITSTSGCGPASVTTDTAGVTVTCTATTAGGTSTNSVTVKRDATAPTLSITGGPADGSSPLSGSVPAAPTCTATDALSGPPSPTCTVTGYSTAVGPHTLTFTATDTAGNTRTATRSYTVAPVVLAIAATAGGGQSTQAGQPFAQPMKATVTDTTRNVPVSGATVTFAVTAGTAAFPGGASATAVTDAQGVATAPVLTAGQTAGPVTVTATAPGVDGSASFAATVTAPPPPGPARADLSASLAVPASATAGTPFTVTLTVRNAGPAAATTVGSGLTLPSGLRVTGAGGGTVTSNGRSVAFVARTLAPGAAVTYTVQVTADRGTRGSQQIAAATASAVRDPAPGNNAVVRSVTVR